MKDQIEAQLQVLIELPLWDAGRAADLEWFQFGTQVTSRDRHGGVRVVGEYALHVQCQWRLMGPGGIVTGRPDLYYPSGDPDQEPPDWQWDRNGSNRCDERMARFITERASQALRVEEVCADQWGSVRIALHGGYVLDLLPANSLTGEHWRLLQPGSAMEHFVVTGEGIEQ